MDRLEEFNTFLFERGILGIMMGTIGGLAVTNLVKDMKDTIIYPLLQRSKVGILKAPIISSLFEFFMIMILLYGLYHVVLYPWFKKQIEKEKEDKERNKNWREDLLQEVKNVDMGTVYM